MITKEAAVPTKIEAQWLLGAGIAEEKWNHSVKSYYESIGMRFFDYRAWFFGKIKAEGAYRHALDKKRRAAGDKEILERLETIAERGQGIDVEYQLTRARLRAIAAIVRVAKNYGRLYCSYAGLAREAGISARSACTIRRELELLGVLKRTRTGGLRADGVKCSNKYTIKYNRLREVLGIENKWKSKYEDGKNEKNGWVSSLWPKIFMDISNAFYSQDGFAHYSRSARQIRRLAQRAREYGKRAGLRFKSGGNVLSEQEFCALTALQNQKRSLIPTPLPLHTPTNNHKDKPKNKKCTPQSGSLDNQSSTDKTITTMHDLKPELLTQLEQLPIIKQREITTYINHYINNQTYKPLATIIGNTLLKVKLQAAKSSHNKQANEPL